MSETLIDIATLKTRQEVKKITATLAVIPGADTTNSLAVTFDNPYVNIPEVLGVVVVDPAAIKGKFGCVAINTTGLTVSSYQVLAGDLITANYDVEVTIEGWKAA